MPERDAGNAVTLPKPAPTLAPRGWPAGEPDGEGPLSGRPQAGGHHQRCSVHGHIAAGVYSGSNAGGVGTISAWLAENVAVSCARYHQLRRGVHRHNPAGEVTPVVSFCSRWPALCAA